jgi:Zn-dependent protease
MDAPDLLRNAMYVIPLILSLTVHEFAHAWSAWQLGDDTAQREGRLTLNPLVHMDPLGTLLLPLLGIPFGWAKPVPVNPARFRRDVDMGTGMMLTAVAGPLANVLLAIASAVSYGLTLRLAPEVLEANEGLGAFLLTCVVMNVGLALFNMLPIPPLDGSRVVERLLPYRMREGWARFAQFAPLLLLGVLFVGGRFLQGPIGYFSDLLYGLIGHIAS